MTIRDVERAAKAAGVEAIEITWLIDKSLPSLLRLRAVYCGHRATSGVEHTLSEVLAKVDAEGTVTRLLTESETAAIRNAMLSEMRAFLVGQGGGE